MADPPAIPGDTNAGASLSEQSQQNIDFSEDDGDVILILPAARLRVSSVILSSASPVFKAMLGPRFSEGQRPRSVQDPKEIALPDDDTTTMADLCRLIHHQGKSFALSITQPSLRQGVKRLLSFAIAADKYGCAQITSLIGKSLLSSFGNDAPFKTLGVPSLLRLSAVAYLFGSRRHFAQFTRDIALRGTGRYSSLASDPTLATALSILPSATLLLLDEQRTAAWLLMSRDLALLAQKECTSFSCEQVDVDNGFLCRLAQQMTDCDGINLTWPPHDPDWNVSIRDVLRELLETREIQIYAEVDCVHMRGLNEKEITGKQLRAWYKKISRSVWGLCLCCLRERSAPANCSHTKDLELFAHHDTINDPALR
ncbi:hypothetical protein Q7P37_003201 [Cladosporium fusiforme]